MSVVTILAQLRYGLSIYRLYLKHAHEPTRRDALHFVWRDRRYW